jgi:hypothetical protein
LKPPHLLISITLLDATHAKPYEQLTFINSAANLSDLTSDAVTTQSDSQLESQTPGGSTTSLRRFSTTSSNNTRKKLKPTSLSFYRSTEVYLPLFEAKEFFAATAFASGCFFFHLRSRHLDTFKTYARDAIAQAASSHNSKCLSNLYHGYH